MEAFSVKPSEPYPAGQSIAQHALKPGHWFTGSKTLRANRQDQRGQLEVSAGVKVSSGEETLRSHTGRIVTVRPAVLPKGQSKRLDFRGLTPLPPKPERRRAFLRDRLVSATQGILFDAGESPLMMMRPEEYFFVILTTRPERFAVVQVSDWVSPPLDSLQFTTDRPANYRVVLPNTDDGLLPLPETMLDWTSTAYILWDDLPVDRLTPDQLQALVDWVHWGGRIIINGPGGGQSLSESDLAQWLPLQVEQTIELDGEQFAQLMRNWSVKDDQSTQSQAAMAAETEARVAVDGPLAADAQSVQQTEGLVLQRGVGLGQIVMTRFDLTNTVLLNWDSLQSFYNNALLRRPPRRYARDAGTLQLRWVDPGDRPPHASAVNSAFRLFARDGQLPAPTAADGRRQTSTPASLTAAARPIWHPPANVSTPMGGVGAWTDHSDTAARSLTLLREQSGISIPEASFVARSLGWYLLVLVPLNYLVFRLLGRLEWAWLAVPLIGVGGAVWVARAARLDIGFARSRSQIDLLEMQPGYGRAHATSYIALYNSLSSTYQLQFSGADAAAAPVGIFEAAESGAEDGVTWRYAFEEGPSLSGLRVVSNRTRVVHTEQVLDVGGPIMLDATGQKLRNASSMSLVDTAVIRRSDEGVIEVATVGISDPGSEQALQFRELSVASFASDLPLQIGGLMRALSDGTMLAHGQARLVARVENAPSGLTITPDANQVQQASVLLVHLSHPPLPPAGPDANLAPRPSDPLDGSEGGDDLTEGVSSETMRGF